MVSFAVTLSELATITHVEPFHFCKYRSKTRSHYGLQFFPSKFLLVREYRGDWGKAQYSTAGFLRNRQPCTLAASLRYSSNLNGYQKNRSALSGLQEG